MFLNTITTINWENKTYSNKKNVWQGDHNSITANYCGPEEVRCIAFINNGFVNKCNYKCLLDEKLHHKDHSHQ